MQVTCLASFSLTNPQLVISALNRSVRSILMFQFINFSLVCYNYFRSLVFIEIDLYFVLPRSENRDSISGEDQNFPLYHCVETEFEARPLSFKMKPGAISLGLRRVEVKGKLRDIPDSPSSLFECLIILYFAPRIQRFELFKYMEVILRQIKRQERKKQMNGQHRESLLNIYRLRYLCGRYCFEYLTVTSYNDCCLL